MVDILARQEWQRAAGGTACWAGPPPCAGQCNPPTCGADPSCGKAATKTARMQHTTRRCVMRPHAHQPCPPSRSGRHHAGRQTPGQLHGVRQKAWSNAQVLECWWVVHGSSACPGLAPAHKLVLSLLPTNQRWTPPHYQSAHPTALGSKTHTHAPYWQAPPSALPRLPPAAPFGHRSAEARVSAQACTVHGRAMCTRAHMRAPYCNVRTHRTGRHPPPPRWIPLPCSPAGTRPHAACRSRARSRARPAPADNGGEEGAGQDKAARRRACGPVHAAVRTPCCPPCCLPPCSCQPVTNLLCALPSLQINRVAGHLAVALL